MTVSPARPCAGVWPKTTSSPGARTCGVFRRSMLNTSPAWRMCSTSMPKRPIRSTRSSASQRGFRSGLSAPSTPYLHSARIVGRADRPSSIVAPNRNITKKKSATSSAAAPPRRPEQVEMRRAGFSATTRQGIKNATSPAGNVGERARRRPARARRAPSPERVFIFAFPQRAGADGGRHWPTIVPAAASELRRHRRWPPVPPIRREGSGKFGSSEIRPPLLVSGILEEVRCILESEHWRPSRQITSVIPPSRMVHGL